MMFLAGCGSSGSDSGGSESTGEGELGLVEDGKLACIANMYFPPFEYMDDETHDPEGFDIDLGAALAEHMGLEVNWLPTMQFDTLVPTIKSGGTADCAISGMTITAEREQEVAFSDPYIDSNQSVVVRADSTLTEDTLNDASLRVAVEGGTTGESWTRENLPEVTVVPLDDVVSAMTGVSTGSYDAFVIDLPVSTYQIKNSFSDLKIIQEIGTGEQYGVAVNKDNEALLEAINKALSDIKEDGTMDELETTWFGQTI
jgi:polar amino acid transport system substrate-binding protein